MDLEARETEWFVEFLRPSRMSSCHTALLTTACGCAFTLACSHDFYLAAHASVLVVWLAYAIFRIPLRKPDYLLIRFAGGFVAYIAATVVAVYYGQHGLLPLLSALLLCGAVSVLLRFDFVNERIAIYEQAEARAEPEYRHRRADFGLSAIWLYAETEVSRRPKKLLNSEVEAPLSRRLRRWLSTRAIDRDAAEPHAHSDHPDPEVEWRH